MGHYTLLYNFVQIRFSIKNFDFIVSWYWKGDILFKQYYPSLVFIHGTFPIRLGKLKTIFLCITLRNYDSLLIILIVLFYDIERMKYLFTLYYPSITFILGTLLEILRQKSKLWLMSTHFKGIAIKCSLIC